jgi:hypothetical protein
MPKATPAPDEENVVSFSAQRIRMLEDQISDMHRQLLFAFREALSLLSMNELTALAQAARPLFDRAREREEEGKPDV